ncbi:MAG: dihydroneopterin aldolase, partial [Enterobacteriaceae bacterium]
TIGVYPWEQEIKQKLIFDLELGWDHRAAAKSDSLHDGLCYDTVSRSVLEYVQGRSFAMVERVAEEVAQLLLTSFKVPWVRIKLSKPGAIPYAAQVGVIIERRA